MLSASIHMEAPMRRAGLLTLALLGTSAAFGQGAPSDQQTLQAILTEVRSLRQDLRVSQARAENLQVLLVRLQLQQGVVARSGESLDNARARLIEIRTRKTEVAAEVKRLEDALGAEQNLQQQKVLQDRVSRTKSELEVTAEEEQQRTTAEIQAAQLLRSEQDKLAAIETQMDDLMRTLGAPSEQLRR